MKRVLMIMVLMGVTLAVTGCHKHSYTVGTGGNIDAEATYSAWESHWFFGIIGESDVDVNKLCPSGNATIKDKQSFLNGLIAGFIGIIWSPTTVEVYCDDGGANVEGDDVAAITLTPEQMKKIAMHPATLEFAFSVSPEKAVELTAAINSYVHFNEMIASSELPTNF